MRAIALIIVLGLPSIGSAYNFDDYSQDFFKFAKTQNKDIPYEGALELASVNWNISYGNFALARRLAAEEATECLFKVLAYLPEGTKLKGQPRTDTLGGHYNMLSREAHKLGLINDDSNWLYSDEFDKIRAQCWKDPAYGTWLIGRVYIRKANEVGMDRASHWWQTGRSYFDSRKAYKNDLYLKCIHQKERLFDKILEARKGQ